MNDDILVARSLDGDLEAFNQLVLEYQVLVYQLAYHLLYDEETVAGAVQLSFVRAFQSLESFRSGSFCNWLLRLVINVCLNSLYKRQYCPISNVSVLQTEGHQGAQQSSLHNFPLQTREWTEVLPHLVAGLRCLTDEQRVALLLNDSYGLPHADIAEIYEIAPAMARACISDARVCLRDYLVQEGCLCACLV